MEYSFILIILIFRGVFYIINILLVTFKFNHVNVVFIAMNTILRLGFDDTLFNSVLLIKAKLILYILPTA